MNFFRNIPFICIMFSMLCAIISYALSGKNAKKLSLFLCAFDSVFSLVLLFYCAAKGDSFVYTMGHFPAPWGNEIRGGILEALVASAFSIVCLLSVAGGMKYIGDDVESSKQNLYFIMTDLLLGSLLALVYTNDLFTAYVFVEISTLSSCGVLIIRRVGRTTLAAVRYMIMSLLGSGLFLLGIVLIYDLTGHLLMSSIHEAVEVLIVTSQYQVPLVVIVSLMSIGLAIKSGLFPFHFWMPDTYGFSTPTSASMLSGLVSKGYIFLAIKIFYRVIGYEYIASSKIFNVLFVFGLAAMIVGSVSAIRANNINRMTAFSSAAQIGYIFMGIGLGTEAGMIASIFHIFAHAVTKPLLFISSARLSEVSGGKRTFNELQGAGYRDRLAGAAFTVGALSMVGLPLLAGFMSKVLFAQAAILNVHKLLPTLIVLAISTILNAVYFLRTVIRIYRPVEISFPQADARAKSFDISVVLFILLNLLLGLSSGPIAELIGRGIEMFS